MHTLNNTSEEEFRKMSKSQQASLIVRERKSYRTDWKQCLKKKYGIETLSVKQFGPDMWDVQAKTSNGNYIFERV